MLGLNVYAFVVTQCLMHWMLNWKNFFKACFHMCAKIYNNI
jgi:hypothetical protein